MKRVFTICLLLLATLFCGCHDAYDDTLVWDKLNDHEERITELEELCKKMNTNISALQTLVTALQESDTITSITPITEEGAVVGYTITFTKSGPVTIYHGKDGANGADGKDGANGADGKDGADGYTPVIGVKQDADGIYYWTLDGEWLLDGNGNKIKAEGTDGKDGVNGEDGKDGINGEDGQDGENGKDGENGITPMLKIEEGYWYVSYDEGATWTQLGKATGENGKDGADGKDGINGENGQDGADGKDGDSFFQSVTQDENNVYFTLADGTVITIPLASNRVLSRLQSMTFVPEYNDGKATVKVAPNGVGILYMDFEVAPKSVAQEIADNYSTLASLKAVSTKTRASEFVDMPLLSCVADVESGVITISASAEALSEEFYAGEESASVSFTLSDGTITRSSDYIELALGELLPADNQIWYTPETDGAITFKYIAQEGATLLSNSYDETIGQWVLSYDQPLTRINNSAFMNTKITTITLPDSVTQFGENVFMNCKKLVSVRLPKGLTNLPRQTFDSCVLLKNIEIPESVTSIGDSVFEESGIKSLKWPESVTGIPNRACYKCASLQSIEIPDSVVKIGSSAFSRTAITSVKLPSSLTIIGDAAFLRCTSLTTVSELPTAIVSLGNGVFNGCTSLTGLSGKYVSEDGHCLVVDGVLKSFITKGVTDYYIPEEVTSIANNAFEYVYTLTTLVVHDGVESIGEYAFSNMPDLESITLPSGLKTISKNMFNSDSGLKSIVLPDSVETIEASAFGSCKNLTSITLPANLKTIGKSAFSFAPLDEVVLPDGLTEINEAAFASCYLNTIVIPNSVTKIANHAFQYSKIKKITIVESITSLGDQVFEQCKELKEVTFTSGIKEIPAETFYMCHMLETVDFGDHITTIGERAFYECKALKSVTFPDSITQIGTRAFEKCESVESVVFGNGIENTGEYLTFYKCTSLKSITLSESIKTISDSTFNGCTSLTEVTIPDTVTEIGGSAFYNCTNLKNVTLGTGLKTMGYGVFSTTALETITIPEGVTEIPGRAFINVPLRDVYLPSTITSIGGGAFESEYGDYNIEAVYLKATTPPTLNVDYRYDDLFQGCPPVYIPVGSRQAYMNDSLWADYVNRRGGSLVEYDYNANL